MKIFRSSHRPFGGHRPIVTIGNFDGVHRGHRAVLAQLRALALSEGQPAVVICFEPQPREYFARPELLERITPLDQKLSLLADAGVDGVMVLRFDARFAALSADAFIERHLVAQLAAGLVLVGDDFRFGHARGGDFHLLSTLGERCGFRVMCAPTHRIGHERVSSTRVREALRTGALDTARLLLGRHYRIRGRVVMGDRIGRTLGFPTANLALGAFRLPLEGIFTAWVDGLSADGSRHAALAYVGKRPVVDGRRQVVEVHVIDWAGDCYGRKLTVTFGVRLRPDAAMKSLAALVSRMHDDLRAARDWFTTHPRPDLMPSFPVA
ncbi:MAG TPA: bifunctional riboflavin kinase/FAD synthetase [Gammaproteobacteria bacterium]|nr:bifunctional riboflavin kinase/FAD synthetase [Gammaproteobacteria bacterium]